MLASLVLELRPRVDGVLHVASGRALHAALLKLVERADPAASARLHAQTQARPFTLSDLDGPLRPHPAGLAVRAGVAYCARLTLLHPEAFEAFRCALGHQAGHPAPLLLDWVEFDLHRLWDEHAPPGRGAPPALGTRRYADLAARATPADYLRLEFRSPTSFQRAGQPCSDPAPELVFRSYLDRWRRFADAPLPSPLDDSDLAPTIELVDRATAVHPLNFGRFRRDGFVGRCTYRLHGPAAHRRTLALLADYAFYCGTGAKTALGMGQTRRLPLPPTDARDP